MVPDELGRIVSLARFRVPLQMCPRIAGLVANGAQGGAPCSSPAGHPEPFSWYASHRVPQQEATLGSQRSTQLSRTKPEDTVEGRRTAPTPLLLVIVPGPAGAPAPQRQGTGADPSGLGLGALGVGYQVSAPR